MKTGSLQAVFARAGSGLGFTVYLLFLARPVGGVETDATIQTNQAPVQLRAAVQVDGAGIFLNQLAAVALPHLRLCDPPMFGKSVLLKRSELAELARSAGFDQVITNWGGAEAIRVTRRSRPLEEKETLQLLTSVLQRQYVKEQGELELRLSRPWITANVPDEDFTLRVLELPTTGVSSVFIVRFELTTASGEHIGSWQAPLQAKVWREVWVAGSPLKRGELLHGADITKERRDMLLCHDALADLTNTDHALEFGESVQTGMPILARVLRPRAIVHRGQSVAALVQDGAMTITLKVEALEDGAAGQVIRVRNPISRRDLRGKILDDQSILVCL